MMSTKSKASLILGIIICALLLVVFSGSRCFCATYGKEIRFSKPADSSDCYDTIIVVTKPLVGANPTTRDSILYTYSDLPLVDTLLFDNDTAYNILYLYSWVGEDGYYGWGGECVSKQTAEATVSGEDAKEIADSTNRVLSEDHGATAWITGGAGSGPLSITVVTADTVGNDTVVAPYIPIAIRNLDETSLLYTGSSDINGEAEFNVSADSFIFIALGLGYTWPTYDTHIVSGDQTDTIWGCRWIPTTPSDTCLCLVYGYARDIEGNKVDGGLLTFTPRGDTFNISDSSLISSASVSTLTDTGYFEINILKSSCRGGATYDIKLSAPRTGAEIGSRKNYTIPDADTHRLVF